MTKKLLLAAVLAIVWLVPAGAWAAQAQDFGVGARLGYKTYEGDEFLDKAAGPLSVDMDGVVCGGLTFTWFISDWFSADLDVEYSQSEMEFKGQAGVPARVGDLTQIPVYLTFKFQPTLAGGFMPYVGAGFGYSFNELQVDAADVARLDATLGAMYAEPMFTISDELEYHVAGGLEYVMGTHHALCVDLRYSWNKARILQYATADPDVCLNAFTACAGYKYYF